MLAVRDRLMADNVAWVADRTDGAVAVWAHDDHVARDAQRPRQADVTAPSMGRRLAEAFDLLCHLPEPEQARLTAGGDG